MGAGGLGGAVVRALGPNNIALGVESGLAIVIVAIILDRMLKQRSGAASSRTGPGQTRCSAVRFENVDVIFGQRAPEASRLLDKGEGRDAIQDKTNNLVAVHDASLFVNEGEILVLMGLSGSGKSSLLRCINGLNKVSARQGPGA